MANKSGIKRVSIYAMAVVLVAAGVYLGVRHFRNQGGIPDLAIPDLNENRQAGVNEKQYGTTFMRPATPADEESPKVTLASGADPVGWVPAKEGEPFLLGTVFHARGQSGLQLLTTGNWIIALDGEGEFIFEDAKRNAGGTVHTAFWMIRKGAFRAKPHDYDPSDHWLQIRTPVAKVIVHKGEIGLRITDGGGGQIWLVSGKATIFWNDGRRKELKLRGMDYI